jgi:hypothetical protein
VSSSLTGLFLSANGPSKRKSTSENPHQSAPLRIPSSRLRNQNIWAELLSGWVGSLHLTLQNAICPRAGARGGGCGLRITGLVGLSWLRFTGRRAAFGHPLTLRLATFTGNTSFELGQMDQPLKDLVQQVYKYLVLKDICSVHQSLLPFSAFDNSLEKLRVTKSFD